MGWSYDGRNFRGLSVGQFVVCADDTYKGSVGEVREIAGESVSFFYPFYENGAEFTYSAHEMADTYRMHVIPERFPTDRKLTKREVEAITSGDRYLYFYEQDGMLSGSKPRQAPLLKPKALPLSIFREFKTKTKALRDTPTAANLYELQDMALKMHEHIRGMDTSPFAYAVADIMQAVINVARLSHIANVYSFIGTTAGKAFDSNVCEKANPAAWQALVKSEHGFSEFALNDADLAMNHARNKRNSNDVEQYLRRVLKDKVAKADVDSAVANLLAKSRGSFLYLSAVARRLEVVHPSRRAALSDIEHFPAGSEGMFMQEFVQAFGVNDARVLPVLKRVKPAKARPAVLKPRAEEEVGSSAAAEGGGADDGADAAQLAELQCTEQQRIRDEQAEWERRQREEREKLVEEKRLAAAAEARKVRCPWLVWDGKQTQWAPYGLVERDSLQAHVSDLSAAALKRFRHEMEQGIVVWKFGRGIKGHRRVLSIDFDARGAPQALQWRLPAVAAYDQRRIVRWQHLSAISHVSTQPAPEDENAASETPPRMSSVLSQVKNFDEDHAQRCFTLWLRDQDNGTRRRNSIKAKMFGGISGDCKQTLDVMCCSQGFLLLAQQQARGQSFEAGFGVPPPDQYTFKVYTDE
eukprot:g2446.t1